VPGEDLGITQRNPGVKGISDGSVPQRVGADVAWDASGLGDAHDHPVDVTSVNGLPRDRAQDQGSMGALSPAGFEHPKYRNGDRHRGRLVALPD
jgi:hypothetical protein